MNNKAAIIKKIILQTQLVLQSPLSIGSGTEDGIIDILVLKDGNGNPMIPGTSMAGVLRSLIKDHFDESVANLIFGEQDSNQSMITVSDVQLKDYQFVYRDCVKLDVMAGTALNKYDYEAVERGAHGDLKLEITVRNANEKAAISLGNNDIILQVANKLADLLTCGIRLGSKTNNGLGQVKSRKPVSYVLFDFEDGKDADKWLDYVCEGKLPSPYYVASNDLNIVIPKGTFSLQLFAEINDALLVKDYNTSEKLDDASVQAVQMTSKGNYVIPGSSVKGVLCHEAFRILLRIFSNDKLKAAKFINNLMGYISNDNPVLDEGEPSDKKGRLAVDEVYINKNDVTTVNHTRIRINRFTRAVMQGSLFTEQPIWQTKPGLTPVEIKLSVGKCTRQEAGLLLLLIKQIFLGKISLGSGRGIGRGYITGKYATIKYEPLDGECLCTDFVIDATNGFIMPEHKQVLNGYVESLVGERNG